MVRVLAANNDGRPSSPAKLRSAWTQLSLRLRAMSGNKENQPLFGVGSRRHLSPDAGLTRYACRDLKMVRRHNRAKPQWPEGLRRGGHLGTIGLAQFRGEFFKGAPFAAPHGGQRGGAAIIDISQGCALGSVGLARAQRRALDAAMAPIAPPIANHFALVRNRDQNPPPRVAFTAASRSMASADTLARSSARSCWAVASCS